MLGLKGEMVDRRLARMAVVASAGSARSGGAVWMIVIFF